MNIWKILGIVVVTNVIAQSVISVATKIHNERTQSERFQMEFEEKKRMRAEKLAKRGKKKAEVPSEEA